MSIVRGRSLAFHFGTYDVGWRRPVFLLAFMALQHNSLHAGTMAGGKADMNAMAIQFDILCGLRSALKIVGLSVRLVAL